MSTPRGTAPSSPARSPRTWTRPAIVGMAYASQLLVAKVVKPDGSIPLTAESDAIRWAADSGAKVINLSLGGLRDPLHPNNDYYSSIEASAVGYAIQKGVVIVAAVGNSDEAPSSPWNYASYPAALPHVIGVSALTQTGDVAGLLEPRSDLQRHLRARRRDLLDVPAGADRESAELHRPGLLRLRRARLLQRGGDVVRRAAGLRRRGDALRRRPGADELPGRGDPRAERRRRERDERLPAVRGRPRPVQRLGTARRRAGDRGAPGTAAGAGQVRDERRRGHAGRGSCGARRSRCPRRSTTTTTRSTSTRSRSGRESG